MAISLDRRLAVWHGLPVRGLGRGTGAVGLPQHPDEHGSQNPVLFAVDQEPRSPCGARATLSRSAYRYPDRFVNAHARKPGAQ